MKPITKKDVHEMNGMIMDLPAFANLNSQEGIHDILDITLENIYIDTPKEFMEYMRYNLNEKLTETILSNYGIDKAYSKNVNIAIKRILVFYIEKLFQTKGSRKILGTFADIFGNFFENINFYNIVVDKTWRSLTFDSDGNPTYQNGEFVLNYSLQPISISDKENILHEIDDDIKLSNKYLMSLDQYKDYTLFPINTNLVYIQFSGGIGAINNMKTFTDGIRAYAATFFQQVTIEYPAVVNGKKQYLQIQGSHLEMMIKYFRLKELQHQGKDITFFDNGDVFYTDLIYDLSMLPQLEDILHQYKNLNYSDRKEVQSLKRAWQALLRHGIKSEPMCRSFNDLENIMISSYKEIYDEFITALNKDDGSVIDFYMKLYTETLRYFDLSNTYLQLYVNTIFMKIITGDVFIDTFFKPVFEIFIKYFFPVEMEYLNDFIDKMIIKDKWNTVPTEEFSNLIIQSNPFSLLTPRRGLDKAKIYFTSTIFNPRFILATEINSINMKSLLRENRINLEELPIKITHIVFNSSNDFEIKDGTLLTYSRKIVENTRPLDENITSIEINKSSIKLDYDDNKNNQITINIDENNKAIDKQIPRLNTKSIDNLSAADQPKQFINYGEYNDPNLIYDWEMNLRKLAVTLADIEYGYWESQVEQKYTYNKYLYYKKVAGNSK